jgi:hypothetical protein
MEAVFGKISIGDNQTLSGLLKTAVSELALRATLTTSYFTLRKYHFQSATAVIGRFAERNSGR